ncbi:MAG: glycoside hydrolase family 13 protein [Bryobacteraceae bacterium]
MCSLRPLTLVLSIAAALTAACSAFAQAPESGNNWWRHAVIYEVYPRSFADSNGDGIGDLRGIAQHLDYLKDLGVDAIWLTPFYPSPQVDFGYDISNYRAIDPQFGTMADFDYLMSQAKKRHIRIINDLVLNHTSDQHPWFIQSESSRTNPKANWYVWANGKPNGQPPNNWVSIFGGSAWSYVSARRQYYYHEFYRQQPDLNWRDMDVRHAMYNIARFWMNKGVSGFRLDAITSLFEDAALRNEPYLPGKDAYGDRNVSRVYTDNLPQVHEVLRELRKVTDEYPGSILIGETYLSSAVELEKMYGPSSNELQLPMDTQYGFTNKLSASAFRRKLTAAETKLQGHVPLFVFANHDNHRSLDRYAAGKRNIAVAKLLAALLLTPCDAALIAYGEELGMMDYGPLRKADVRDPIGIRGWPKEKGRDGERTPMQWNTSKNAGFSTAAKTWLPLNPDYNTVNAAAEERNPNSIFTYYKTLIRLRKRNPQLRDGKFVLLDPNNRDVLSYLRKTPDGKAVLVTLNFTDSPRSVAFDLSAHHAKTLLASFATPNRPLNLDHIELPPYGAYIGEIQ